MIHFHGSPIWPENAAASVFRGRHAMVSFAVPDQIGLIAETCQSFALDNGAFSFWKSKRPPDWDGYYRFVETWMRHPGFEWAVIPDVIDGSERDNDNLIYRWPFGEYVGVPVWHLHEPIVRLLALAGSWPRVALGSSGEYSTPGAPKWWQRVAEAMTSVCDQEGHPKVRLHGLRMLDPRLFARLPLSSADSTNVAINVGMDSRWSGTYPPASKATRGIVLADRIEAHQSATVWRPYMHEQPVLWSGIDEPEVARG